MTNPQRLHEALKTLTNEFPGWGFSVIAVPIPSDQFTPQALCWSNIPNPKALHEFIASQDHDKALHDELMKGDYERG